MIHFFKGDLLKSDCDYICHQVNYHGVMGAGIAKQIRDRWPAVYKKYRERYEWYKRSGMDPRGQLGMIDIVPTRDDFIKATQVINMYSQLDWETDYDAFEMALLRIREAVPTSCTIGFPKGIGCGLASGNWNIVLGLIKEVLGETHDVFIYEFKE